MADETSKQGNILVDAAKAIGSAAGKVASLATGATPADAPQEPAPTTTKKAARPKAAKKNKLEAKNKSRLPRREKKAAKKKQSKAASQR